MSKLRVVGHWTWEVWEVIMVFIIFPFGLYAWWVDPVWGITSPWNYLAVILIGIPMSVLLILSKLKKFGLFGRHSSD